MNTLTATQSAPIAESLNNLHDAYPFWGSGLGAVTFVLLTWIAIAGLGVLLSWRFDTPVFCMLGVVAGTFAGPAGWGVMFSYQDEVHAEQTVALKDVVIENIEENYALDDISIEDHNARGGRSAPEQYTADIFGTTATEYVRFEVAYNAEHDIMMPVQDLENTIDIPVRDDSRLAEILD